MAARAQHLIAAARRSNRTAQDLMPALEAWAKQQQKSVKEMRASLDVLTRSGEDLQAAAALDIEALTAAAADASDEEIRHQGAGSSTRRTACELDATAGCAAQRGPQHKVGRHHDSGAGPAGARQPRPAALL